MNGIAHRLWNTRPRLIDNPVILRELVEFTNRRFAFNPSDRQP